MILTVVLIAMTLFVATKLWQARRKYKHLLTAARRRDRFYQLCHLVKTDREAERAQRKVTAWEGKQTMRRAGRPK